MDTVETSFKGFLETNRISYSEAAKRLGVPVGTVKTRISRNQVPKEWWGQVVSKDVETVVIEPEAALNPVENTRFVLKPLRVCKGPPKVQGWHVARSENGFYPALGEGSKLTIWDMCGTESEALEVVKGLRGVKPEGDGL